MVDKKKFSGKFRDKVEEEVSKEAVNFYRAWRQKTKNGILPIGIANVGKTTFLQRFEIDGPSLFVDFNRTTSTTTDNIRLRDDLSRIASGIDFYKKIDVPGDLPSEWAEAYFDNNPRVLAILVDNRDPANHIKSLRAFLSQIAKGPSFWQKTKEIANFRWNNLSRIIFIVNKADLFDDMKLNHAAGEFKGVLADFQQLLQAPVQIFHVSLKTKTDDQIHLFKAVIDGLSRK